MMSQTLDHHARHPLAGLRLVFLYIVALGVSAVLVEWLIVH